MINDQKRDESATFGVRLDQVRQHFGEGKQAFAQELGIARSSLYTWLEAETATKKALGAVVSAYPSVNVRWLEEGEGPMLLHGQNNGARVRAEEEETGREEDQEQEQNSSYFYREAEGSSAEGSSGEMRGPGTAAMRRSSGEVEGHPAVVFRGPDGQVIYSVVIIGHPGSTLNVRIELPSRAAAHAAAQRQAEPDEEEEPGGKEKKPSSSNE